ncbi:hypothetical protein BD410DRAFT_735332 [Rickenella mellea]|uniref:Uncharacterized protein n=1 Tax=Rickenella mellea TaxID=50990 RepID=A0A4Y7PDX8_9AGAM|nr:hypothetical protein BD410DRAFT_735332 [Rickenella mellea]
MVIRDVVTRWNYTHAMIRRASLLYKAVDEWVFEHEELHEFMLTASEWKMLKELANVLEVESPKFVTVESEFDEVVDIHAGYPSNIAC